MPLYEYQCLRCGRRSEILQRISDPPAATCETCGGELKRLVSAPAFQFKGTGWYVTDYARGGSGGGKEAGSKASDGEAGAGTGAGSDASGGEGAKKAGDTSKPAGSSAETSPAAAPAKPST